MKSDGMKILYVSPHDLFDIVSGACQRSYLLLKALASQESVSEIDVISSGSPSASFTMPKVRSVYKAGRNHLNFIYKCYNGFLRRLWLGHFAVSDCDIRKTFRTVMSEKKYDLVIFRYIGTVYRCGWPDSRVMIDVDDLPSEYCLALKSTASFFLPKMFLGAAYRYLCRFERKYIEKADLCAFANAGHLNLYQGKHNFYLPNIPYFPGAGARPSGRESGVCGASDCRRILFVGYMRWLPNIKGMGHFIKNMLPHLYRNGWSVNLRIVGKGLPRKYAKSWTGSVRDISIAGFVKDIAQEYMLADIVIVPIFHGSGTNIKVLEALAYSKPVVATKHAVRGFENYLMDGRDLLVAENDEEFASCMERLLADAAYGKTLGENGRKVVEESFSEEYFISQVRSAFLIYAQ